jgi:hypothetical protein
MDAPAANRMAPSRVQLSVGYQACVPPQCGQPTEVDTWASNTNPQLQA